MYSQYMDGAFSALDRDQAPSAGPARNSPVHEPHRRNRDLLGDMTNMLSKLLGSVVKQFSIQDFDTGDILLVLIILFLFLEGDNLDLVITLGLMLLLGLND